MGGAGGSAGSGSSTVMTGLMGIGMILALRAGMTRSVGSSGWLRWTSAMRARILSCASMRRSLSSVMLASSASQSSEAPSATDSMTSNRAARSGFITHLLGQAHQRATDRHARRVGAGFSQRYRQLLVRTATFNPPQNRFPMIGAQALQRAFISHDLGTAEHLLQRGGAAVRPFRRQFDRRSPPPRPPHFVADAIHQR